MLEVKDILEQLLQVLKLHCSH